jgi:AraC family transcriptional regulator of adaptative response/methylated-DNA-[protein]-cysteine methyltransferase
MFPWGWPLPKSDYSRVAETIAYLVQHAREQPDLARVAAQAGLSEYHFQRMFRHWAGVSPKRFLQFLTLEQARRLLRGSGILAAASLALGLSSPSRLHDLFINFEGMTPGQFKDGGRGLTVAWAVLPTPLGPALFAQLGGRLTAMVFTEGEAAGALAGLGRRWPEARFARRPAALAACGRLLADRLGGHLDQPLSVALQGTPFQLQVWEALLRLPESRAGASHHPAHRTVGAASRRNPVACLIPCHRAIRASGALDDGREA